MKIQVPLGVMGVLYLLAYFRVFYLRPAEPGAVRCVVPAMACRLPLPIRTLSRWFPLALVPVLAVACGRETPGATESPRGSSVAPSAASARPSPRRMPPQRWQYVGYVRQRRTGQPLALLRATMPLCRTRARSRDQGVGYRLLGLWRMDIPAESPRALGRWRRVPTRAASTKLTCRTPVPVAKIAGLGQLQPGTYFLLAEVQGRWEPGFLYVGPMLCQDVHLGPAPSGQIPLCVLQQRSAGARFVPDPLCRTGASPLPRVARSVASGPFHLALSSSGLTPPGDLREALCLARRLVPWPSRVQRLEGNGTRFTITLRRDVTRPAIPGARIAIDTASDWVTVVPFAGQ